MSSPTPDHSPERHGLTEPQRRHLTAFLQQVEEALDEIESQAVSPSSDTKLFQLDVNDLPDGFGAAIKPDVSRVRARLKTLVEELDLESHPKSRARNVLALLLTTIVQVEDSGSRGLRGYGPPAPVVYSVVDPALDEIHQSLERMAARFDAAHQSKAGVSGDQGR